MKSIRTLREMFEDQSTIFERVMKLFPSIDWRTIELNGPDIQDLLTTLRYDADWDEELLDTSIEERGGLDQVIEEVSEFHRRKGLETDNPILALTRAVDFTKAVILAVATLALEIVGSELNEEMGLLNEQFRDIAADQRIIRPLPTKFRDIPMTQDGQIIN